MENQNIETPDENNVQNDSKKSIIFNGQDISGEYIEILKDAGKFELIIRNSKELNSIASNFVNINEGELKHFKEIAFIFDFTSFSEELDLGSLDKCLEKMNNKIDKTKTKLNLIIKNCYINTDEEIHQVSKDNILELNKLEISDELYMLSTIS